MSEIQNIDVDFSPAIINVSGANKSERQLSVAHHASGAAKMALSNQKGKLGAAVRAGVASAGLQAIAKAASNANYKPLAEYLAARLGEDFVISNRASFNSLPDQFEMRIMKAKQAKNGGYVMDKKTGAMKPSAAHALALELKATCVEVIDMAEAEYQARVAKCVALAAA